MELGFTKCKTKYGVCVCVCVCVCVEKDITLISLYVDDLLVTSNNINNLVKFKQLMMKELEMSDLRNLPYFLSMKLLRTDRGMVMHQKKYVMEVLKRFKVLKSNPAAFPIKSNLKLEKNGDEDKVDATLFKQIVGSLRYVRNSRPDIGFSVGLVSRYMDDLRVSHM